MCNEWINSQCIKAPQPYNRDDIMSFLRYGYPLIYVKGESEDYIFPTIAGKKDIIEDYGDISNSGLVEILCRAIDEYYSGGPYREEVMGTYLKQKLASKLKVELRKTPLTIEQRDKKYRRLK